MAREDERLSANLTTDDLILASPVLCQSVLRQEGDPALALIWDVLRVCMSEHGLLCKTL